MTCSHFVRYVACGLVWAGLSGCATTQTPGAAPPAPEHHERADGPDDDRGEAPDASGTDQAPSGQSTPAAGNAENAEPATPHDAPANTEEPSGEPSLESRRSEDGIDDETPLPTAKDSPALLAFQAAVDQSPSDPKAAMLAFADAATKTTYFYAAWFNAGVAAERAQDASAAERYYREALRVRPDYGPALVNLAFLLERSGRSADADALLDTTLQRFRDRAGPHLAAAVRALRAEDLSQAEQHALQAIRIDERLVPAMHVMAQIFFRQGKYETAKFALQNALELEPGNALLHLDLGHVLMRVDEEKNALIEYGKAATLRPELAEAQSNYGLLLLRNGDPEAALVALTRVVDISPSSATARLHLGNALRATKRHADAAAAYKKAMELEPTLVAARFNLGCLYMDNPLDGVDELDQLKLALAEFQAFQETAAAEEPKMKPRLAEYIESVEKRINRIERRLERERQRKLVEQAEKEEAAAKAAAEGAAEPTSGGDAEPAAEGGGAVDSGAGEDGVDDK